VRSAENREKAEQDRKASVERKFQAKLRWEAHVADVLKRATERAERHKELLAEHQRRKAARIAAGAPAPVRTKKNKAATSSPSAATTPS